MRLSPLDPLRYGMPGTRAPGAHVLIAMIACATKAIAGDEAAAGAWAANVRERNPALTREDFLSFPMKTPAARMRVSEALPLRGF